jgi:hypothetical protein
MWKCKECNEKVDNNLGACWNCGVRKDGSLEKNFDKSESVQASAYKDTSLQEVDYDEQGYNTARFISKVIAFIGWVTVTVGIIIAIIGFATSAGYKVGFSTKLLLMLPGLYYSFAGLITVAFGQIMRATVDNASHTKEIAKNSREMLELKVLEIKKKYKKS